MFPDHIFLCDNETFLNEYSVCTYLDIKRNFLQSLTGIFSEFFSTYYIQLNNLKINKTSWERGHKDICTLKARNLLNLV